MAQLFKLAIYVNASSQRLRVASHGADPSEPIVEGKRWVKGQALLARARALGQELPLIFAHFAPLTYWAVASEIVVDDTSTTYRFSGLKPLRGHRRSSLVVASTDSELPDDFIRSYALVHTPAFLQPATSATRRKRAKPLPAATARESTTRNSTKSGPVTREVGARKQSSLVSHTLVGGRFRLGRLLGQGGQGEAFEALDDQLPERGPVVIKFASVDTATREFTMAMRLRHDHVCQYFDVAFDQERNRRYLVIEHGGQSLAQYVAARGALAKEEAIPIVAQAASALDYAHSKQVIHHDVSPGNILIDSLGHVRVTDFGIAVVGASRTLAGGSRTMVADTLLGRHPVYAAPEMSTGEAVRGRADQYSLALVLCSLLEGEVFTRPYRPREFQRLSSRQNAAVRRALSKKADARFPTCAAFVEALEAG